MADNTSITQAKLSSFKKSAKDRQQLGCEKIAGFFYLKLSQRGAWRLRYTDLTGKRRTATIADGNVKPVEAADMAIEWKAKLKKGIDPLGHKEALSQQAKEEQRKQEANTYLKISNYFEAIYTPYKLDNFRAGDQTLQGIKRNFGHLFDKEMPQITSADILSWYNKRRKKGVMRSTLVRDFGAFKAMLNYATKPLSGQAEPILGVNPIKDFTLPALTITEQDALEERNERLLAQRDIFSDDIKDRIGQGLRLYSEQLKEQRRSSRSHGKQHLPDLDSLTFPHWFIPFCHIARLTGMRPADIYNLKWEYVTYNQFNGQTTLLFTPSKTKKAENSRKVRFPVTGELKSVFDHWGEQQGSPNNGLLFKSERTGRALDRKAHLKHWKHVKELGGLPPQLEFYSFRHNFISELVARGVPVLTIAGLVGHKDGTMIAGNYLRHDESDLMFVVSQVETGWQRQQEGYYVKK